MDERTQPLHLSVDDGGPGANADGENRNAGGGGAAKLCGMGIVGVTVTIVIILALAGGIVAWVVMSHHHGPSCGGDNGGPNCASCDGSNCLECNDGFDLLELADEPKRCFYKCHTDLEIRVRHPERKGLTVDDTTLHWCAENMPYHFPNTNTPPFGLRLFKAWQGDWDESSVTRRQRWGQIADYLHYTGAKVLLGTQISCDPDGDDADWADVLEMIQLFGAEHIMGLAIGNELELLFQKQVIQDTWLECMNLIWTDHYFYDTFKKRVADMDRLGPEYAAIPVTSVFGGAIFAGWPFLNVPVEDKFMPDGTRPMTGLVLDFLNRITIDYGMRWVWSLNVYPYFDEQAQLDEDGIHCNNEIARATCFIPPVSNETTGERSAEGCEFTRLIALMRDRMAIENFNAAGARNGHLWIGETGWSYPKADTLSTMMQWCPDFSSEKVFSDYYKAFLEWDMGMTGGYEGQGPDFVFWFTMRDSSNFELQEHFGLVGGGDGSTWCTNTTCKLQDRGFFSPEVAAPITTTIIPVTRSEPDDWNVV